MDVVYARREATAREVMEALPEAPSYSTVRTLLGLLVRKGWLKRRMEGRALVYAPARPRGAAAKSALRRLVRTFFDGSVANAVSGLLGVRDRPLSAEELAQLEQLIADTRQEDDPHD